MSDTPRDFDWWAFWLGAFFFAWGLLWLLSEYGVVEQ